MLKKMFFAGYGGQGIMLAGQMVASAAILENKETTFFPSYGPEMRGGTANCTVIVSDKPISSPLIFESDCVLAMNLPSMLKFEPTLKPGGVLLLNTSLIHQSAKRSDVTVLEIAANELAMELGNALVANMIMLGAFVRTTGIVKGETMEKVIHNVFAEKKADLVDLNLKAFNHWKP
ncbi:MAG: 2-oxoacid:acceptor oxidoreductase family protein [Oscillospiraceae bacterium]|nr:2-oxoacid:acceptor oxidoreductase family protein [Oscillospiraceae bacterium]